MLTRHSSAFQIIPWNWKILINRKVQENKVFWHIILHSSLRSAFFIKIESNCFSKTYSEIESTWSINSSKEEIVLSRDIKYYLCNVSCEFLKARRGAKLEQTPQLSLLYYGRAVRYNHRRCSIRKLFIKISKHPQETPALEPIFKKFAEL